MCPTKTTGQLATIRQLACNAARNLVDVPYHHQGRSTGGVDCIGLVVVSYHQAGLAFDLPADYSASPKPRLIYRYLDQYCEKVTEPSPGDIVVMALRKYAQHIGMYLGNGQIVHSYRSARRVIIHDVTPKFQKQIISYHRVVDGIFI